MRYVLATLLSIWFRVIPDPLPPNCWYAPEYAPDAVACNGGDTEEHPGWNIIGEPVAIPVAELPHD